MSSQWTSLGKHPPGPGEGSGGRKGRDLASSSSGPRRPRRRKRLPSPPPGWEEARQLAWLAGWHLAASGATEANTLAAAGIVPTSWLEEELLEAAEELGAREFCRALLRGWGAQVAWADRVDS